MTEKDIFGAVAVLIALAGQAIYLHGIWKGRVKPHSFTWFLWAILMAIAFAAQRAEHGGAGSWVLAEICISNLIIAAIGVVQKDKNIARSDWVALFTALSAIPVWQVTHNPLWAVIIASCIDAVSFYPTYRKSWHRPQDESATAFAVGVFQYLFSILALDVRNLTTVLYPAFVVVVDLGLVVLLLWRRKAIQ